MSVSIIDKLKVKLRSRVSMVINIEGDRRGFDVYLGNRAVLRYYSSLDIKNLDLICDEIAAHIEL